MLTGYGRCVFGLASPLATPPYLADMHAQPAALQALLEAGISPEVRRADLSAFVLAALRPIRQPTHAPLRIAGRLGPPRSLLADQPETLR